MMNIAWIIEPAGSQKVLRPPLSGLLIALMILSLFGQGCRQPEPDEQRQVIADSVMVAVLADFFLTEGVMIQLEYIQQKQPDSAIPIYEQLFRKHGITREDFRHSLEYYAEKPLMIDKIYDQVIQQLSIEQMALRDAGAEKQAAEPRKKSGQEVQK
jgi:uncharacterized Zn finger protein